MAYFALLWKARTIEKCRHNYEREKLNAIRLSAPQHQKKSLYQRLKTYNCNATKTVAEKLKKCFPKGSCIHGCCYYTTIDQTFPNFVLKSIIGFVGGIILTYLCFMFFVFQLAISMVHAAIMSSIIGVLLTLGLAFSYRIRCLVFLLIPQFFSRVGRYTLTCYALVLILTGPAKNTMQNSEVLSESMACKQEQIKSYVGQINESMEKPFSSLKDSIQLLVDKVRRVASNMRTVVMKLHRLVTHMAKALKSTSLFLDSVVMTCNQKLGTPYEMCTSAVDIGVQECQAALGARAAWICNSEFVAGLFCAPVKPLTHVCVVIEYFNSNIVWSVESKLNSFTDRISSMLRLDVHFHHSYSFSSNSSRSASQVAAGVVTEMRRRADPLLTWLSWSSCVTSLFLLLIIFRAKYYQNMFETRSRFDNRYITKELRELDLKRMRQGRATVLPLNRREKAKYITTTSFRLVSNERVYLSRSAVFMVITTFKLLIHIVADYSLYWVLITIRYHGRFQTPMQMGASEPTIFVTGTGLLSKFFQALLGSLRLPLQIPPPSPVSCLPDPYPPNLQRYAQIGVLIILLWFFAMFEPYGLRLRHVIMGMYRPERAKARALWLYNHIQRTRGSFMKFARRKLHRENKYSSEAKHTLGSWLNNHIPCVWLKKLLGIWVESSCLLCGTVVYHNDCDTTLVRCETPNCPGTFCVRCFSDIGDLCTICLSPEDYGDMSDISLEKGSCAESDDGDSDDDQGYFYYPLKTIRTPHFDSDDDPCQSRNELRDSGKAKGKSKKGKHGNNEDIPLLAADNDGNTSGESCFRDNKYNKIRTKNLDCETSSIYLLKKEFESAIDEATRKLELRKSKDSIKQPDEDTHYYIAKEQVCVQTSTCVLPMRAETSSDNVFPLSKQQEITEIMSPAHSHPKKYIVRRYFGRNKVTSRYTILGSNAYNIKFSRAHFCVTKCRYDTKPARMLKNKFKLIFRRKKPKNTIFTQWFRRFAKKFKRRSRHCSRLTKREYQNKNNDDRFHRIEPYEETREDYNENNVEHYEEHGKNNNFKNVKARSSLLRKIHRIGLTFKKRKDCFRELKCISSTENNNTTEYNITIKKRNLLQFKKTNHELKDKDIRIKKSVSGLEACISRRDTDLTHSKPSDRMDTDITLNDFYDAEFTNRTEPKGVGKSKSVDVYRDFGESCVELSMNDPKSKVHPDDINASKLMNLYEIRDSSIKRIDNKLDISHNLSKMLKPFSVLYSCFFGTNRSDNGMVELLPTGEKIAVHPIVNTCATQNFTTKPVEIQPTFRNVDQDMSLEVLHGSLISSYRQMNSNPSMIKSSGTLGEESKTMSTPSPSSSSATTTTIDYVDEIANSVYKQFCDVYTSDTLSNNNRSTSTETKPSEVSSDWWSPILERSNCEVKKADNNLERSNTNLAKDDKILETIYSDLTMDYKNLLINKCELAQKDKTSERVNSGLTKMNYKKLERNKYEMAKKNKISEIINSDLIRKEYNNNSASNKHELTNKDYANLRRNNFDMANTDYRVKINTMPRSRDEKVVTFKTHAQLIANNGRLSNARIENK